MGEWTVIVKDTNMNEFRGNFTDWRLNLWGEAIDGNNQGLHPLPDEHDDDHGSSEIATHVATTVVTPGASQTDMAQNPTDHIDRPVNAKPTGGSSSAASGPSVSSIPVTSSGTFMPLVPSTASGAIASATATTASDNLLPSFFPTFGVSKRTQIWIYGSFALIIIFCLALGVYFLVQRRKRIRNNPHDDYEFEMVAEDEEGLVTSGQATGQRQRRRGGELYDAFAGESDEEVFSDEEDEPYYDQPSAVDAEWSEKSRTQE